MIQVSVDRDSYESKPDNVDIVRAKRRAAQNWTSIEADDLAEMVGNGGHAFVPAHLEGGIKAENCTGMQVYALDFDKGITFEQIKDRCDKYGLKITFAYNTYSSTPKFEKFRIVFVHETVIGELYVIRIVLAMLGKIFPECDQACKNPDRIFLGGKELIYLDSDARMALVQLISPFYSSMGTGDNFSRNIKSFCKKYNIMMVNNLAAMECIDYLPELEKIDGFIDPTNIYIIAGSTFPSIFIIKADELHQNHTCKIKPKRLDRILNEISGCALLDDFNSGVEIDHNSRFAILTNLVHVMGGFKHFFDILDEYYDAETYEKWKRDAKYIRGYLPQRCSGSFCSYYGICENCGTIIETIAANRKVFRGKREYVTEEEARKCLEDNLEKAFLAVGPGIHLIKAQTAMGKTTAYIALIERHPDAKFIIALPTNDLKNEVAWKLSCTIPSCEIFVTASVVESCFFPPEIKKRIQEAHQKGFHNKTKKIVKEYMEKIDPERTAEIEYCEKVIAGINAVEGQRVIVTTHAFLLQIQEDVLKNYTVIVDEDILYLQILNNSSTVSVDLLEQVSKLNKPGYTKMANMMLSAKEGYYVKVSPDFFAAPSTEKELENLDLIGGLDDNLNDIVQAGAFVRKKGAVTYFCPRQLRHVKYIVLSATLNTDIYRKYFLKSLRVVEYPEMRVQYKGNIYQYTYHSLGRSDLSNKPGVFDFARKISGNPDIPIITFKSFVKAAGASSKGMHFGNAIGRDILKGKDIAVIGTSYKNEESYKLPACFLGADVNSEIDVAPKPRRVTYHGDSFRITTYSDEILRELQMYSLESEMEQAVGRARVLREDCTVYVFSCFPCEQSELRTKNYLIEQ